MYATVGRFCTRCHPCVDLKMALPTRDTVVRREDLEEDWEVVGRGGFGRVYKARHKEWGFDVAVKILKQDASHIIFKEARCMEQASCEFVLRVYGVYQGPSSERGLVMEYMKRGSMATLQTQLSGAPPWPVAFRLTHQVALAMNFLHAKNIVHVDLKPNNVLLSNELNAKLADFGLSTVSRSVAISSTDSLTGPQGTYNYMPPEAFQLSYKPVRAFDIYSYGILLWSLFTGEEPFPNVGYSLVELRISEGDRPRCDRLLSLQVQGVTDIVQLMQRCWNMNPTERPPFKNCLDVTERLFSLHSNNIHQAVDKVLAELDGQNQIGEYNPEPPNKHHEAQLNDNVDAKPVSPSNLASSGDSSKTMNIKEKAKFVDRHRPVLTQKVSMALAISEDLGNMVHSETYNLIQAKETDQEKMRVLYSKTLRSGGDKVKAAFYDALEIHEPFLMEELKQHMALMHI